MITTPPDEKEVYESLWVNILIRTRSQCAIRESLDIVKYTVAITFFLSVYAFGVRFKIVA